MQAREGQGAERREALRVLLLRYCGAAHRYLLGAAGDADAAENLAQEFALRFVRGDFHRAGRGRFRDYLKAVLRNLVADYQRQRQKQPRPLPADAEQIPEPETDPADAEFLAHWREELLAATWRTMEQEQRRTGSLLYTVLRWRAANPKAPSAELAEHLSRDQSRPVSVEAVRQTLHRARQRFSDLLLDEVACSLETSDLDRLRDELTELELLPYCQAALARREGKKL